MKRLTWLLLGVAVAATGCKYEDPYSGKPARVEATARVELQRTFLSKEVSPDGLAHDPVETFVKGDPIFLTVMLQGSTEAKVDAVLLGSESDTVEIARSGQAFPVSGVAVHTFPLNFGGVPSGSYYVSVRVNGVPSWGLPFSVTESSP